MLDRLSSRDFAPYLNQRFRIHGQGSEPMEAELIAVTELGPAPQRQGGPAKRAPFSIVLRGAKDAVLPQGIYRVEHEAMGRLDIFLVTIGPDEKGMRYEALFA